MKIAIKFMSKKLDGIEKISSQGSLRPRRILLDFGRDKNERRERKEAFFVKKGSLKALDSAFSFRNRRDAEIKKEEVKQEEVSRLDLKPVLTVAEESRTEPAEEPAVKSISADKKRRRAMAAKKRKKAKRLARRRERRKRLAMNLKNILKAATPKSWKKTVIFSLGFLVVLFLASYFLLATLVLKFNFNNQLARKITEYAPVPALITRLGMVGYFEYQETMADYSRKYESYEGAREAVKAKFVREMILADLVSKYGLATDAENLAEKLNENVIRDQEINRVARMRLMEIKQALTEAGQDQEQGREEIFNNFDNRSVDQAGYLSASQDYAALKAEANKLAAGEISDIIAAGSGYYLLENKGGKISFVFIQAVDLESYLVRTAKGLKILVLAD